MSETTNPFGGTGTGIDLGTDLLRKPQPQADSPQAPGAPLSAEAISDLFESARIQVNEGFLDDAKKSLRKILLSDPSNAVAQEKLEEIHELELKQILGRSELSAGFRSARESAPTYLPADEVAEKLDRELGLGIFREVSPFRDREGFEKFALAIEKELAGSPASERTDLGIAFLEMGLHELAIRQFQAALSAGADQGASGDASATCLLACALIAADRAFEATLAIEHALEEPELAKEIRLELAYLMGRAHEKLGNRSGAAAWYGQAAELDPGYRDAAERRARLR